MSFKTMSIAAALVLATGTAFANEPPTIDHQGVPCTVADKPTSICASVSDDSGIARARIFFRAEREKYFNLTEMAFGGIEYCGTIPPVREGKAKAVEYYIQAIDDSGDPQRTSTFLMRVESDLVCDYAPIERDPSRATSITVYATHKKQGGKISGKFDRDSVAFVRVER